VINLTNNKELTVKATEAIKEVQAILNPPAEKDDTEMENEEAVKKG